MSLTDTRHQALTDRLPSGLLDRIVAHLDPVKVIVFGSQATGNTHKDSDWDLLIVVDDSIPAARIDWKSLHEVRRGIYDAIDLIACRQSKFQEKEDVIGSLPWIAATKGILVYERAPA